MFTDLNLTTTCRFDCILNLAGPGSDSVKYLSLLKPVCGQYITISPPSLQNYDKYGFLLGTLKNTADFVRTNLDSVTKDRVITKWGFFMPSAAGLRAIGDLIQKQKVSFSSFLAFLSIWHYGSCELIFFALKSIDTTRHRIYLKF